MKFRGALFWLATALQAMPATAEPCVGNAFDRPFPGAVEVSMHHADVPASQFPGLWQEGRIDGQFYQIFANRVAILQAQRKAPAWSITVDCRQAPCALGKVGNPPEAALGLAAKLKQCLVPPVATKDKPAKPPKAGEKPAAAKAPAKPEPKKAEGPKPAPPLATAKKDAAKPANPPPPPGAPAPVGRAAVAPATGVAPGNPALLPGAGNPASDAMGAGPGLRSRTLPWKRFAAPRMPATAGPQRPASGRRTDTGAFRAEVEFLCTPDPGGKPVIYLPALGLTLAPMGSPVAILQQLLVLAGADPGEIDGLVGLRTQEALVQVLGNPGRDLAVPAAIAAVQASLCKPKP